MTLLLSRSASRGMEQDTVAIRIAVDCAHELPNAACTTYTLRTIRPVQDTTTAKERREVVGWQSEDAPTRNRFCLLGVRTTVLLLQYYYCIACNGDLVIASFFIFGACPGVPAIPGHPNPLFFSL